jgi:hypothetical protein
MNTAKYTSTIFSAAALCMMTMFIAGCKKYKEYNDVIFITGTETNKIVKFTVEGVPSSFGVTVSASTKVSENITVNFQVDTTLVKSYNEERSANYFAAPAGSYEMSATTGVIKAGTNISDPLAVRIISTASFVDGRTYIIPVTIKSVSGPLGVLEASRTIFLKIAKVSQFNAIDISNPNFYDSDTFPTPLTNISKFTFEIKCLVNSWHTGTPPISRLCNWGPASQTTFNLLRFGEGGSQVNQLQWINSSGGVFSNTLFELNKWYTISCVYDGSSCKLYVDGQLDNSFDAAGQLYEFGAIELGMSFAGYQTSQRFLGRIAEIRFWDRVLSKTEIAESLCGVDATSNGLVAYWKMNEGTGNVFIDRTGKGRNMTWTKAPVVWNSDLGNKCAQ